MWGLTKAGLMHHFSSKEELLSAVLELRDQRAFRAFYAEDFDNDPVRYLRQVAAQTAFNESQPGLTQMFSVLAAESSNEEHPAHEYFQRRYKSIVDASSGFMAPMIVAGTFAKARMYVRSPLKSWQLWMDSPSVGLG